VPNTRLAPCSSFQLVWVFITAVLIFPPICFFFKRLTATLKINGFVFVYVGVLVCSGDEKLHCKK